MVDLSTLNNVFLSSLKHWGIENKVVEFFLIPTYASIDDIPSQGFKLHVSATILNCNSVAEKIIPFLLQNEIQFKVIKDVYTLADLNRGWLGYSQIGKFITIYPRDTSHLKEIAKTLSDKTSMEYGPVVPTDKKIGNILYYRFGSFYSKDGETPTLTLPNSQTQEDAKTEPIPDWIVDPLLAMQELPTNAELPNDYFITEVTRKSGKGGVYRILDFKNLPPSTRYMKEAVLYGNMEVSSVDAIDRMRWEIQLLKELSPICSAYPAIIYEFPCGDHYFLVLEDKGKSLKDVLVDEGVLDLSTVLNIILQLCQAVQAAHSKNIILRDLSLDNVLWDGKSIGIIDLEYAYRSDGPQLYPIGTPGFSLRRQMVGI